MHENESDIRHRLLVARLPAMPQILLKLIEQCQSDDVGMSELAELISKDAGMAGKILAIANSSAYHRNNRKVGLEHSLMTLGVEMIKTLVISESVLQVFNNFSHSSSTDLRSFWKHSLSSAVLAREIASAMTYSHLEEAYLAGLLHDVGRLALLSTANKEYAANFLARDDEALSEIEEQTFRITHQEAGAWLIERWNLDSFLSDSVLYHHDAVSRLENTHPLIRIVRLAHLMSVYDTSDSSVQAAASLCEINEEDLSRIASGASEKVEKAAAYLGIDLAGVEEIGVAAACEPPGTETKAGQKELSEEVLNFVLNSEAGRLMTPRQGETQLLEAMARSARILFDFEDTATLLMNRDGKHLVGVPLGGDKQRLKEFTVTLSRGGPVAEAAMQRRMAFIITNGNPLGVSEEQLLRILRCDSLVCLPLVFRSRCLGVLVGGVAAWQVPGLRKRERFLKSFGEQAASALEKALDENSEASRRVADVVAEYQEASRKIVHEVNNPLSIIKNYLSVLDSKLEQQELVSNEISILNQEIDRVSQIVRGLADLKPETPAPFAEVNRVIRDVARLFRDTEYAPASVKIVVQTQDLPTETDIAPDPLKQILVNLVKNAVEAVHSTGEIQIVNNGHVNRDGTLYVEVCVIDNGPGIPPEILGHLFHPLKSSKGDGHQGLGLRIVHGLVKKHQGLISCRSSARGTRFELLLPVRGSLNQDT
ncbi:HDOD domain-containing protein [Propionivibrio sp.]|uniref:HDOD domain-containing protein n=1 Tax=Propionivibrio sp. TaxID=2212460 RepID=UPI00272E9F8F|nr:HDOD domain-containing protein [Propionivibrio sp.]